MAQLQLLLSKNGKYQITDQGYNMCLNKMGQNNRFYFQCTHGISKFDTWCKATAICSGALEAGQIQLLSHQIERHNHAKSTIDNFIKDFYSQFIGSDFGLLSISSRKAPANGWT